MKRTAEIARKTRETDILVKLELDGPAKAEIDTGIGFFDHMLTALAIHSGVALTVRCEGDLEVDCHHTIEDVGIALGQAYALAFGDKSGIRRYSSFYIPMDESLGFCAVDVSGRPFLVFDAEFAADRMGGMDTQMVEEFFRALAMNAGITLHLKVLYGKNDHHKTEALFKAAAHALREAVSLSGDGEILSTKGVL